MASRPLICQDYGNAYETTYPEYDSETELEPRIPPLAVPQPPDYGDPYNPYPQGCARECYCPSSFPLAMYCDHRKLKAIPDIPRHIRHLYIQFNEIEAITAEPFVNATSLKEINLSHNSLKSSLVERNAFTNLKDLLQLYLDHNNLEEVPASLPKTLQRLSLGFNRISKLSVDAMQGLASLTVLDLCNNRLTDGGVRGKTLSGMKALMQVNMCNNKLKSMPSDLPASVLQLSLENNSIASIPDSYFKKTPNLLSLRVSHNKLKAVPYTVFNLSRLMELNLGHNQLSKAFFIPRALEHLYLNHNEFLDLNVTLMCPSLDQSKPNLLTYIRIDNNRLSGPIDYFAYRCFPRIRIIFYGEQKLEKKKTLPPTKKPRLMGDAPSNDGDGAVYE
ncbi:osteomodulin [Megalops cyprinoides]|uniref:osteomodulin n=1 Tax=Megalops cyprinoides TaxID=118141 RepID=UPI001863C6D7|nr:osteomodulin [Megalops cyprinoides]